MLQHTQNKIYIRKLYDTSDIMKKYFTLETLALQNKTVLLRTDYNVPIQQGIVQDTRKIKESLHTIQDLLKRHCTIVIATHIGRPNGKHVPQLSAKPVAKSLQKFLPQVKVLTLDESIGAEIKETIQTVAKKNAHVFAQNLAQKPTIIMLENLRFYKEEEENDSAFAHSLANLAELYVNDAFADMHRKHASICAITQFLPSAAGFLVETELLNLKQILEPKRPSIWIIGGAKLDKVELFTNALRKADKVLVGGALAFSFLKGQGKEVGHSKISQESIQAAQKILTSKFKEKLVLPTDVVTSISISENATPTIRSYNEIEPNEIGLDVGPKTMQVFKHHIQNARTILWNGPLGYTELDAFSKGTKKLIDLLSKSNAITICGGGETEHAIRTLGKKTQITHISTGGGATLHYLTHETLPGIIALEKGYSLFRKKLVRN